MHVLTWHQMVKSFPYPSAPVNLQCFYCSTSSATPICSHISSHGAPLPLSSSLWRAPMVSMPWPSLPTAPPSHQAPQATPLKCTCDQTKPCPGPPSDTTSPPRRVPADAINGTTAAFALPRLYKQPPEPRTPCISSPPPRDPLCKFVQ